MAFVRIGHAIATACAVALAANSASAQLADSTQVTPTMPGGHIAKSLEQQVGAGHGDELTPGSSVYLIKRDPARSIRRGRQLFQRKFTMAAGRRAARQRRLGGEHPRRTAPSAPASSDSCAGCHGRPRGSAGFGGDVVTRPDSRDAPHLFGLGLQEMLADEITTELRAIRARRARDAARAHRKALPHGSPGCGTPPAGDVRLVSKGISYGRIRAFPNGTVDTSRGRRRRHGPARAAVLRPGRARSRSASSRSARSTPRWGSRRRTRCCAPSPIRWQPARVISPGRLRLRPGPRPLSSGRRAASSRRRRRRRRRDEIDTAIDRPHGVLPAQLLQARASARETLRTQRGRARMDTLGCTSCHVAEPAVQSDRRVADVETVHDPVRGIFNRLFATARPRFVAIDDGRAASAQILPTAQTLRRAELLRRLQAPRPRSGLPRARVRRHAPAPSS